MRAIENFCEEKTYSQEERMQTRALCDEEVVQMIAFIMKLRERSASGKRELEKEVCVSKRMLIDTT